MVIQTVSSRVIRQALSWADFVPTHVQYWTNNIFRGDATGSIIILVFDDFIENYSIKEPGNHGNHEMIEFIKGIDDCFCNDIKVIGWNYNPLYDQLKVYVEHSLADGEDR